MSQPEQQESSRTYETLSRTRDWFREKADSAHARVWLGIFSFTESCVFIIPPDPLLAALVFLHKERWIFYTALTVGASVAGAIVGYLLGAVLFDTVGTYLITTYALGEQFAHAQRLVEESVFVFTLTAAFTPIPFKLAVLTAGVTKANFFAFIAAATIGRLARYALIAYVAKVFGDNAEALMRRFWFWSGIGGVLIIGAYTLYLLI